MAEPADNMISLFDSYRRCEEHENEVMHHRTTWFVTVQSVLVATFGFSYQKYYEISERIIENFNGKPDLRTIREAMAPADIRYQSMLLILCIIGTISSLGAFSGIGAARAAQAAIRMSWERLHKQNAEAMGLPPFPARGSHSKWRSGSAFPRWLALAFVLLWIWIAFLTVVLFKIDITFSGLFPKPS